jgi:hypothetical protein
MNRAMLTPDAPASGAATAFNPGTNFDTNSDRKPNLTKRFSVLRTHESGSMEMRHMNRKIFAPRHLPSWNQAESASKQPKRPHARTPAKFNLPIRARAPEASNKGIEGSGSAACSAKTQKKTSEYP